MCYVTAVICSDQHAHEHLVIAFLLFLAVLCLQSLQVLLALLLQPLLQKRIFIR